MQFKYINQIEGIDHALAVAIKKGEEIKLNGKVMKYDQILKNGDVLTVKNKGLIERLELTGVYEKIKNKKSTTNESGASNGN